MWRLQLVTQQVVACLHKRFVFSWRTAANTHAALRVCAVFCGGCLWGWLMLQQRVKLIVRLLAAVPAQGCNVLEPSCRGDCVGFMDGCSRGDWRGCMRQ